MLVEPAELGRDAPRRLGRGLRRAERGRAHEHEPHARAPARELVDGAHRGGPVEPVPQPAVPQHDLVVGADRGKRARIPGPAPGIGRAGRDPNGTVSITESSVGSRS